MSLIIHAPNIHHGGGRTLLLSVLNATSGSDCVALLDSRLELPEDLPTATVERVAPTLLRRLLAEWRLARLAKPGDTVLCFGNLPPLMRNHGMVRVFLQNRYLFGLRDLRGFTFATRWRIRLERLWFKCRFDPDRMLVYVQTSSMAAELQREAGIKARVFPFAPRTDGILAVGGASDFDFIYVASGEPHKNHLRLIEAWKLLGMEGFFPSLCLTLDPSTHPRLGQELRRATQDLRLRITNLGSVSATEAQSYYRRSRALIYPSTLESFGLPLIEASRLGLPILASELDYVRDVVVPTETFDPGSPLSIARSVKRFLLQENEPPAIFSSEAFVREICSQTTTSAPDPKKPPSAPLA